MSHETILYGRIIGAHGSTDNWYELYHRNKKVIEDLPAEDTFPPLTRDMFMSPLVSPGTVFHQSQVIVFGASFKNFDDADHRKWISKFESLLRQLFWLDVHVHLDIELYGKYEHCWKATNAAVLNMRSKDPMPVTDWQYAEKIVD